MARRPVIIPGKGLAMSDDTWKVTYRRKPEWWDDDTEPRCDVCGVHCEDCIVLTWCGECGNCSVHCTCDVETFDLPHPPKFSTVEEADAWLDGR